MTGNTATYGLPYPEGGDLLSNVDQQVQALANAVERMVKSGNTVVNVDGSSQATINFPVPFAAAPVVTATMGTSLRCALPVAPGVNSFTVAVTTAAGAAVASGTAVRVYWIAVGKPA